MRFKLLSLGALTSLLVAVLFAVAPARAQSVDDKIRALEEELGRLKAEQIEMKKTATEAAAALPTWRYRAGRGVTMEAADKSWAIQFSNRTHFWLMFRDAKPHRSDREGDGELFARRIRPTFNWFINDGLFEVETAFDLDSGDAVALQRATAFAHLGKINPWLPTVVFGIDAPTAWVRRTSSSSSARLDYDMLSRSVFNTGSQGWAYGLLWEGVPLTAIGIPGQIEWFNVMVGAGPGNASDGGFVGSDAKSYVLATAISPFSKTKNKWLSGLEFGAGVWFCNFDNRADDRGGCDDAPIRETDGPDRATLFDADVNRTPLNGKGTHKMHGASLRWRVGPYQLLGTLHWFRAEGVEVRHRNWFIAHDLYIWSPKGFLTGSASTPNSILIGTHFERSDASCSIATCNNGGEFTRNHVTLISGHVSYWIQRGLRVGVHWNHYDAAKIRSTIQDDLDIRKVGIAGKGGSWDNVMLIFTWEF